MDSNKDDDDAYTKMLITSELNLHLDDVYKRIEQLKTAP
jgi:hypothetical protein